jgi:ABC-type proline/glycine betaine transport system permease subunit
LTISVVFAKIRFQGVDAVLVILVVVALFLLGQKYVWGDETDTVKTYVQAGFVGLLIGVALVVVFQAAGCVRAVQWFF